jgi:hypothetical protein
VILHLHHSLNDNIYKIRLFVRGVTKERSAENTLGPETGNTIERKTKSLKEPPEKGALFF